MAALRSVVAHELCHELTVTPTERLVSHLLTLMSEQVGNEKDSLEPGRAQGGCQHRTEMTVEESWTLARNLMCELHERRTEQGKAAPIRSKQPCTLTPKSAATAAIALQE